MASSLAILHHLLVKPTSSSTTSSVLIKPLALSLTLHLHKSLPVLFPSPQSSLPPHRPRFFCNSSSASSSPLTYPQIPTSHLLLGDENDLQDDSPLEEEPHNEEEKEGGGLQNLIKDPCIYNSVAKLPTLTTKEKKELVSYAHSLGKKLKIQQVGKSGVTDSVAASFIENLESNELLKLKIHNSCPGELPDVIKQLEVTTGSVAVGQIGRSVILYRPSLTKLEAEEKKRRERKVYVRKGFRPKPTVFRVKPAEYRSKRKPDDESMEKRSRPALRLSGRGRREKIRNEIP